jgi:hypothetical protein
MRIASGKVGVQRPKGAFSTLEHHRNVGGKKPFLTGNYKKRKVILLDQAMLIGKIRHGIVRGDVHQPFVRIVVLTGKQDFKGPDFKGPNFKGCARSTAS